MGDSTLEQVSVHNENEPIWDLVIKDIYPSKIMSWELSTALVADMRERDETGRKRYGTPLQAHNGRDAVIDAYQEALDLVAYLKQATVERPGELFLRVLYRLALLTVVYFKRRLLKSRRS